MSKKLPADPCQNICCSAELYEKFWRRLREVQKSLDAERPSATVDHQPRWRDS